jgi:preprotein translocase subunit SecG
MLTFALIVAGIISILLMLVVLIQNPKGGGLASNFSAGNQIFGAGKTSDLVEKLTWGFAIAIILISVYTSSFNRPTNTDDLRLEEGRTDIEDILDNAPAPTIPKVNIDPVAPVAADATPAD